MVRADRRGAAAGRSALRRALPALTGLVLGLLVLGPGLAPGFVLSYDMVFVPDPPPNPQMFGLTGGFPRPVPSDAVVAALAAAVPAQLVQKGLLLAVFALAAGGAARLVPGGGTLPRLAAAVFYVWNPYVAERLVLGHWALLLGYAGLPWAVYALVAGGPPRRAAARLTRALLPAAIGGFAAMNISALTVAGVLVARRLWRGTTRDAGAGAGSDASPGTGADARPGRSDAPPEAPPDAPPDARPGRLPDVGPAVPAGRGNGVPALAAVAIVAAMSLPWLVPALFRLGAGGPGAAGPDPAGVALFAARADTPFGTVGSLLSLGGIWNREVVPPGYADPLAAALRLALSGLAIGAYALLLLRRDSGGGGRAVEAAYRGLALSAAVGLAVACLGVTAPGRAALQALVGAWPGFAALRDGQLFVAPLALVEALGLGALAAALSRRPAATTGRAGRAGRTASGSVAGTPAEADPGGVALAALAAVAPVALLPALAWGAGGRLEAASYPADWVRARAIIAGDPVPGAVLSLPWAAHRREPWNGGRTLLDPAPRMLARRVVWNDALVVGGRDTAAEDPAARTAGRLLRTPGPLTPALAASGYRYVLTGRATDGEVRSRLPGARRALAGTELVIYRIDRPGPFRDPAPPPAAPVIGGLITLLLTVWSFGASGPSLVATRHTRQ